MATKFDPAAPVLADPPAIVKPDTSRAEQVIEQVKTLDRQLATNQFEMGDLFAEIVDGDYFHADHCESLHEFLKKNGFDLSPREIFYRVKISRVSKSLGISRDQLLKAKISKVKTIFELDPTLEHTNETTGNIESMADVMRGLVIDAGAGKPLKDIRRVVHELVSKTAGEDKIIEWWNIPTFRSRAAFYDETIEMMRRQSGDTVDEEGNEGDISKATAIERIFAEWRADPQNTGEEGAGSSYASQPTFQDIHFIVDEDGREIETAD